MGISLSAIVPTAARDLPRLTVLRRSLESALHQTRAGDELICAADTFHGPLDEVRELCLLLSGEAPEGVSVRFVPFTGTAPDWGHAQLNHAMSVARGDYLTGCDDDDVWTAGAFDAMREQAEALPSPRPLLFKFLTHYGLTVWDTPGVVRMGGIGGHCLVAPNLPSRLGVWEPHYEGDFSYVKGTIDLWAAAGVEPVWVDRLICIARPGGR